MEWLPHHVVEQIMERLDAKILLKLKSVSKQWKSSIESPRFQKRQLFHRKQSGRDPEVLFVSLYNGSVLNPDIEAMRTLVLGSSVSSVKIPTPWENKLYQVCNTSCDGLICLYDLIDSSIVVNPTTRWHRTLPPCNYYQVRPLKKNQRDAKPFTASPGFGKDKINGTYKLVWLYNNGLINNPTTCEVFDFTTNAWRFLLPTSPYPILDFQFPVYSDGSLLWFTTLHEGETMVLSFDLYTETFQVLCIAPFLNDFPLAINMFSLDDRLCVSQKMCYNLQNMWSFDSDRKTWTVIGTIDLDITSSCFGHHSLALTPLAVLGKDKLLLCERMRGDALVTFDPKTNSYNLAYTSKLRAYVRCYFPSLISIL